MVNAMTNLVLRAVRKIDLSLLATVTRVEELVRLRRPHHGDPWTVAGLPWRKDEGGHLWRRHGGAAPDIELAESARWLRALSMESRQLRSLGPRIQPSPIGGRPLRTGYSCAWRRSRGLVPFRRLHGAQGRSVGDFLTAVPG